MNVICYIIDCMDTYERLTCKILAMMTWALQLKTKKNLSENELFNANSMNIIILLPAYFTRIETLSKIYHLTLKDVKVDFSNLFYMVGFIVHFYSSINI